MILPKLVRVDGACSTRINLLAVCCLSIPLLQAQTGKQPTLAEALAQSRTPLVLAEGKLSGSGTEVLAQAIASAQFVLLGEDHFSREIPQLASALCDIIHPDVYVVEVGPEAARFVGGLLNSPDRMARMRERDQLHPMNMAFLDIREENDLAAHCAQASHNPRFELWGLDQEFVGSAGTMLEAMAATKPGPQSRLAVSSSQVKERETESQARASGKVEQLFLLASTDAQMQFLQQAIAMDGNDATKGLLAEFLASRRIYQMHLQGLPESNAVRAQLLKQHFMTKYSAFKAHTPTPHIFIKFGGMHTGKGFSFLHQRDLGNFIAEQADLEGTKSLHIFVVGAHGVHSYPSGYGKAVVPESFDLSTDPDWSWLQPALSESLPQQTGSSGTMLTLFDLRQLRFRHLATPDQWEQLIYRYDLLVLVPDFTAATPIQ